MKKSNLSFLDKKCIIIKSFKTSLIVGTIITLINQNECFFKFIFTQKDLIKILFNYIVPFTVSAYSRISLLNEIKKEIYK
ncbi:MAG: nitrate/nitrite transporter NrtS [Cyanobacteriota bacterium]